MERPDQTAVAVFFAAEHFVPGGTVKLGEDAAHHARVRRLEPGARVRLVDGSGGTAVGSLRHVAKSHAVVEITVVDRVSPLPAVHLLVPIADRDRMLWLAEKSAELGLTSWRPTHWRRSRSVSPRGEGPAFREKVVVRMSAALTQCGGAWLPTTFPDSTVDRAIAASPSGTRWLLDLTGASSTTAPLEEPLTIALGPEGGIEPDERNDLIAAGFMPVALGGHVLRFETAGIAALAIARTRLASIASIGTPVE